MIKLYYGNEPYCLLSEKKKIKKNTNPLDLHVFEEWNRDCRQLAFQVPFLSEKNVIILELDKLVANEELLLYVKDSCEESDLYIFATQADKNTKLYKELKAKHEVMEFNKISKELMQKWVIKQLKELGASITSNAYELLLRRIRYWDDDECNLFVVKNYLLQIAAYSKSITEDVIMEFVPATVEEKVFSLSGYLLDCNEERLFHAAIQLLKEKEAPIAMLSAILRTFRLAYKAKLLDDVNSKERDSLLGAPSYQYAKALRLTSQALKECMDILQGSVNCIKNGYPGDKVFLLTLGQLYQKVL